MLTSYTRSTRQVLTTVERRFVILATLLLAVFTLVFYRYQSAQPPDAAQIERCNEQVNEMPESTPEEINRSIHAFYECLES
ncbi:MAG: hypothetical protein RQ736_03280 [Thiogranum sp.]|nr:hypothetical protein [Thiogranum sp.]